VPSLTSTLGSLWCIAVESSAGKLFLASAFLLLLGLAAEIWYEGCDLQSFARTSLREIEARHPHIPALLSIAQILAMTMPLFVVSLLLLRGFGFLPDTRTWMLFAAVFLVILVIGILTELHWKSAAQASFAFSTGTTLIFLWILLKSSLIAYSLPLTISLAILLLISVLFIGLLSFKRKNRTIPLFFMLTVIFWLCVAAFLS
jgi:hypothetical protein